MKTPLVWVTASLVAAIVLAAGEHIMTTSGVLDDVSFCHLVVGVTDMDRALAFYRDVLGMDVVFETLISGEPFDAVLHAKRKQEGRVVGGLLGALATALIPGGIASSSLTPRWSRGRARHLRGRWRAAAT